ncbi:hypothetical protein SELMODRAFT_429820 [Selaginella moellendorffii]|uniref:Uncharacterized protein n=1 Tax=Selaginella moellendorffii TaxID=88036 RepID=D8T7E8_SELML|nr:hypothetical protein SELMODRAFT_429820 [Selaginella moellendorffii]
MRRGDIGFYGINLARVRNFKDFFGKEPHEGSSGNGGDVLELLGLDLAPIMQASLRPSRIACSSRAVEILVKSITCVTKTHRFEEVSDIENLSKSLLELFRLDLPGMRITRRKLELKIGNTKVDASPGVVVETEVDGFIRLVVQIDRSFKDRDHDPEAEMIASGIATYQELLDKYKNHVWESPPEELLLPGIVMRGTCPTFYLMRLSREMVECVKQGRRPGFLTRVDQYVLPGLVPPSSWDAIIVPEHRAHIAQCLESLKSFIRLRSTRHQIRDMIAKKKNMGKCNVLVSHRSGRWRLPRQFQLKGHTRHCNHEHFSLLKAPALVQELKTVSSVILSIEIPTGAWIGKFVRIGRRHQLCPRSNVVGRTKLYQVPALEIHVTAELPGVRGVSCLPSEPYRCRIAGAAESS